MKRAVLFLVGVLVLVGCSGKTVDEVRPTPVVETETEDGVNGSANGGSQLREEGTYAVAMLEAVDGSDASGSASAFLAEDGSGYRMSASFENLAEIDEEKFFYEGWLVRGRNDFISTGRMERVEQVMINSFESEESYMDYGTYVLTLEPTDDGENGDPDPAPAAHVVEGKFVEE